MVSSLHTTPESQLEEGDGSSLGQFCGACGTGLIRS